MREAVILSYMAESRKYLVAQQLHIHLNTASDS